MVIKGFSMQKVLAYAGLACFVCGSFAFSSRSGIGQDQTEKPGDTAIEKPATPASKLTPKAASVAAPDATKEAPQVDKNPLPDVIYSPAGISEADASGLEPVQAAIKAFSEAFNAHDAKTVAALFTAQAEITNQAGHVTRGREAIQETFGKLFAAHSEVKIRFEIESMRFLSPDLAVEEGVSIMTNASENGDLAPHHDRYTITHAKVDDKWLVASARDWPAKPLSGQEQLQQLEWLIGEWVDENGETLVHTAYHWSADKHYLLSEYSVQRQGQPAVQGTQRIGWDPRFQKLHSWTFDTAGGFSEGLWSRSGDQWIVKITGVAADGQSRSATNILTRLSKDHASYQSRDRVVGGAVMPDMHEVPIVRKPPQPTPRLKKGTPPGLNESSPTVPEVPASSGKKD